MALNEEILKKIEEWTNQPYGKECIDEIKSLQTNEDELRERFAMDLDFGTGGMRGIIRNGTNGMNIYVIAKTTQGLANYIKKVGIKNPKASIAYDSRKFSKEFATEAAIVLASNGIKTYLFKELRPTPELSFAVRHLGCTTGIVVTASHNPKEYNGYKVYWDDGAQVVAPHDKGIIEEVKKVKKLTEVKKDDFDKLIENKMIEIIGEEIDEAFINEILKLAINKDAITKSKVKIVFTPLHGTGVTLVPKALKKLGFNDVIYVDEQMVSDPNFSTVKSPNPEEKETLNMGIQKAKETNADILIATDPDADRMGIVAKNKNGEYVILSGNQIGSILEYYVLSAKQKNNSLPKNGAVVKTIVTTNLQDDIAKSFDVKIFNMLTGFKFIGQKMREFDNDKNYTYLFGGEESYGYLTGTHARDKDAICATLMIAECCAYLKNNGLTLVDYLEEIFTKYGYYDEQTISEGVKGLKGIEIIKKIMEHFRKNKLTSLSGIKVVKSIDYLNEKVPDAEGSNYILAPSDVIQFFMEDGSKITLRPSGTEPKIKFYFSTKDKNKQDAENKTAAFAKDFMPAVHKIIKENS
ncbi:MAG: hypothetical protein A2086_09630 [Spirochaetes bacterium GWD1_27_9]|nr:MAG: hypothetical protein A2Z98_13555 [Spirochaetes bacterium GWB1_27_13]OHD25983.1 MAG: hypothetical protein A2Y34_07060 [Spirochaetes bacterium GWC1_27_15]OHD31661.1 MAG: hypothetical protein A2086_09630 [Spirochaetes bacterium GWD1_27_9]